MQAGTDLSCSIWTPGFNKLANAVRQGLVSEDLVTQAAERLYKARFQLGLFDPQGANSLDRIPFTDAARTANRHRRSQSRRRIHRPAEEQRCLAAEERPRTHRSRRPDRGSLPSILGNYVGTPLHPVTPLEGIINQFKSTPILYAQGSTLAEGVGVPVPRTAFGLNKGLKTEFFATPDWTGRPVATGTEPAVQADWENAKPVPEVDTHNYSVRWSGTIAAPAPGHYVFTVEVADSFPYSPAESFRFMLDGKVSAKETCAPDMICR